MTLRAKLYSWQKRIRRRSGFTRLSPQRQITLPLAVVEQAGIQTGEELAVEVNARGRVIVSRSGVERPLVNGGAARSGGGRSSSGGLARRRSRRAA